MCPLECGVSLSLTYVCYLSESLVQGVQRQLSQMEGRVQAQWVSAQGAAAAAAAGDPYDRADVDDAGPCPAPRVASHVHQAARLCYLHHAKHAARGGTFCRRRR